MRQVLRPGALEKPRGIGWRGRWEGGLGWGIHVTPWLIYVNVWQNPLQYCKVISLQLIKINGKKKDPLHWELFLSENADKAASLVQKMTQWCLSLLDWRKASENSATLLTSMFHISGTLEYLLPGIRNLFPGGSAGKESIHKAWDPSFIPGLGEIHWKRMGYLLQYSWASQVSQTVKNMPAIRETWVQYLAWEDPREKGMATHSSVLAWRTSMDRGATSIIAGGLQSMGSQKLGCDWATKHSTYTAHIL